MLRMQMKFCSLQQGGSNISSSWVHFQLEDPVEFPEELQNPNILGLISFYLWWTRRGQDGKIHHLCFVQKDLEYSDIQVFINKWAVSWALALDLVHRNQDSLYRLAPHPTAF